MRRLFSALVAAGAVLVAVSPAAAAAAAPHYIMVSGRGLARPVLLDRLDENGRLFIAVATAPRAKGVSTRTLKRRPRLQVTLFWGWSQAQPPTRPSQGNQRGWFYPKCRSRRAILEISATGKVIRTLAPKAVLKIFKAHRIPTTRSRCTVRR
jgi:hypothetical protein